MIYCNCQKGNIVVPQLGALLYNNMKLFYIKSFGLITSSVFIKYSCFGIIFSSTIEKKSIFLQQQLYATLLSFENHFQFHLVNRLHSMADDLLVSQAVGLQLIWLIHHEQLANLYYYIYHVIKSY